MKFLERLEEKMGSYLNPSKLKFEESLRSEIYVDKTGLLTYTNSVISTRQKYLCVSRPRRFGKSMAVEMLAAYYSRGADSGELFQGYKIAESSSFHTYLNRYDVIAINMQEFLSKSSSVEELIELLQKRVLHEVLKVYRDIEVFAPSNLQWTMQDIYQETGIPFIILIDEWDCIFREYQVDAEAQRKYLDFLRDLLKDKEYVALAYMTGILPIKKYGSHSALNMFQEFSMTDPAMLAEFVGFTEKEVRGLCERYRMSFEETKSWYDGYCFPQEQSVYSPKSVVEAMLRRNFNTYWNQTETFEALKIYIQMNYEGLRDAVVEMIAGGRVKINTGSFTNDMTTFHNADDVMTLLVHLGYLAYDMTTKEVFIPNREVCSEYINAVKVAGWNEVIKAVEASQGLLNALWNGDGQKVADGIEEIHESTSVLQYHDENAMSYTISLALYAAREYYNIVREMPAGKGFADICCLPRKKYTEYPALIIELKWDKAAEGAIQQIKERRYIDALKGYEGKILLAGINYDRKSKKHTCIIEEWK